MAFHGAWIAGLILLGVAATGEVAGAAPRVFSLDQCADQYALALAPRDAIVGLSPRVGDRDSYLRASSLGLARRRASSEAVLAAHPDVVIRYWGGDARLARTLAARGIRVVDLDDVHDFNGVRADIRRVAAALDARPRGEALIAGMDVQLRRARGAGGGRPALYLTPSGFTAGPDTLIGAMLRAAGFVDAARAASYTPAPLERLVMAPPAALVLGFFDVHDVAQQQWGVGRHWLLRRLARGRTIASLPASVLGCPAWFSGDAVRALAAGAKGRS